MSDPIYTLQIDSSLTASIIGGTASGELLLGTGAADTFDAGAGNDTLEGAAGIDTAIFSGSMKDYELGWDKGFLVVTDLNPADGNDGTDRLMHIDRLQFADDTLGVRAGGVMRANTDPVKQGIGAGGCAFASLGDGGTVKAWIWGGLAYVQRFDAGARAVGEEHWLAGKNTYPGDFEYCKNVCATTMTDGRVLLAWQQENDPSGPASTVYAIVGQWIDAGGRLSGSPFELVAAAPGMRLLPSVASLGDGGFALSWFESSGATYGFVRMFDADGLPRGDAIGFGGPPVGSQSGLDVLANDDVLVTWATQESAGADWQVHTRLFSPQGEPGGEARLLATVAYDTGVPPRVSSVALEDGGWFSIWTTAGSGATVAGRAFHGQRFDSDGSPQGEVVLLDAVGSGDLLYLEAVRQVGDGLLVAWSSADATDHRVYAQRFSFDGSALDTAVFVDSVGGLALWSGTLADGRSSIQWATNRGAYDQYAMLFDADGNPVLPRLVGTEGSERFDLHGSGSVLAAGQDGDDTYLLGDAGDRILERPGSGRDTVVAGFAYTLSPALECLELSGTASIAGEGNALPNVLIGNQGANRLRGLGEHDTLQGGGGNDTLSGGGDSDRLQGGEGADTFRFGARAAAAGAVDVVLDFSPGVDTVALDARGFKGFPGGVVSDAQLLAGPGVIAATTDVQRLLYDTDTGNLYYDRDGSGPGASVWIAVFGEVTHPTLTAADFALGG